MELLKLAEKWTEDPTEEKRVQAMEAGMREIARGAAAWAALAAGWSGGSMVGEPNAPVAPPPYLTAQAARAAILTGLAMLETDKRQQQLDESINIALKLIEPTPRP
jgi:hypothetical protein